MPPFRHGELEHSFISAIAIGQFIFQDFATNAMRISSTQNVKEKLQIAHCNKTIRLSTNDSTTLYVDGLFIFNMLLSTNQRILSLLYGLRRFKSATLKESGKYMRFL